MPAGRARDGDPVAPVHEPALVLVVRDARRRPEHAARVGVVVRVALVERGEGRRLPLEARHEVGPRVAEDAGPRAGCTDERTCLEVAQDAGTAVGGGVPHRQEHVVLRGRREGAQLGVHALDRPEQLVGGVDQVRTEVEQRDAVAQAGRGGGDLDHLGAGRSHRLHSRREVGRHALKIVRRHHDAPSARRRDEIVEAGTPFDIDVFGAAPQGLGQGPEGERDDEPVALGRGQEGRRGYRALVGVVPAQKRLEVFLQLHTDEQHSYESQSFGQI